MNIRFFAKIFTRVLSNGEACNRECLVYSKELDSVFCFYCKLLRKRHLKCQLTNKGFNDCLMLTLELKTMKQVHIILQI